MKLFLVSSDINESLATKLTMFLVECKRINENALLIINAQKGRISGLNQIIAAYIDTSVHITAIGMGTLENCASAIFCMADERILIPDTEFSLHPCLKKYYSKTRITDDILNKKCNNNLVWQLTEKEIQKYDITTKTSEGWIDIIANCIPKSKIGFKNSFFFNYEFSSEYTLKLIMFLIQCKVNEKDAFVVINSNGGSIKQLKAILNTYEASGIHLTALGIGMVASCAAGLFCMADERSLAPMTEFIVHHSNTNIFNAKTSFPFPIVKREFERLEKAEKILVNAYITKTDITQDIFEEKCENGSDWNLTEDEIQKYNITTKSSEGWTHIVTELTK